MFAVKRCTRCGQDIYASDLVMRVRDNVYHLGCFTCAWCNVTLCPGDYFGLIGNLVYCRAHYTIRSFHQGNNHTSNHNHNLNSHGIHSPCSESMEYISEHAVHPASGNHHHSTVHHHRLSPSSGHHPLGSQHQAHLHMGQQVGGSLDHPIPPPHSLYGSVYGESLSSLTAMAGVTDSMNSGSAGFTRGNHALHHHHQQNDGHAPPSSMTPTNSPTTASSTATSAPPPVARKGRPRKRKISINPSAGADASSPSSTTANSYCSGLSSVDVLVSKDHSGTTASSITGQCISLLDGGLSSSSQTPPNLPCEHSFPLLYLFFAILVHSNNCCLHLYIRCPFSFCLSSHFVISFLERCRGKKHLERKTGFFYCLSLSLRKPVAIFCIRPTRRSCAFLSFPSSFLSIDQLKKGRVANIRFTILSFLFPLACDLYIHSDGSTSSNGQLNSNGTTTGRTKRMRTSFKHHQLRTMKQYFAINQNPDAKDLKALAQKTNLSKRVLQVWFQNARAKWRRNNLKLQEAGHLSSSSADRSVSYPPSGITETTELTNPSTPSPSTTSPSVISCMMYE